jgi:hypothetical protein
MDISQPALAYTQAEVLTLRHGTDALSAASP